MDVTYVMSVGSLRYPLVGGTRQRPFAGTHSKPRKMLENAQTPTRRVHAVLAGDVLKVYPIWGSFPVKPPMALCQRQYESKK
jgi:hypothetical protein